MPLTNQQKIDLVATVVQNPEAYPNAIRRALKPGLPPAYASGKDGKNVAVITHAAPAAPDCADVSEAVELVAGATPYLSAGEVHRWAALEYPACVGAGISSGAPGLGLTGPGIGGPVGGGTILVPSGPVPPVVPEPSSLLVFVGIGLALLVWARFIRRTA